MWVDLNARARGLRGRLLSPTRVRALSQEPDVAAIARALVEPSRGFVAPTASARQLDLAIRRMAAAHMMLLVRWMGARASRLRVVLEDEDRRSLRALIRGAAAGVAAEARLAALMPTPGLPESALELLASAASPARVGAALVALGNPYGSIILEEAGSTNAGLFAVEVAIDRLWAERSCRAVRRAGRELRRFVEETIDVENSLAALALAANREGEAAERLFVTGGRRVTREVFKAIAMAPDSRAATRRVVLEWLPRQAAPVVPRSIERWLLGVRIRALTRQARLRPAGPSPVLEWVLRLRAQTMDLGVIVWGRALGAAPEQVLEYGAGA